jgi:L-alanine-DL-glutamate epimerase-like enolase superfamily enzyme
VRARRRPGAAVPGLRVEHAARHHAGRRGRRLAELREAHGYRAFKIRIGAENGHDADEWPGRTGQLVPAVREAVGADAQLLVDANSCYTPARAIEVGRMLESHGVVHLEEPCPYWELEWTAQVAAALDLDVTGGEQDCLLPTWRRMFELQAVDIAQPDVCYVGGFTRALRVAGLAADAGIPIVPHSANLTLVTVFALHLLCAIPNAGRYVEFSIEGDDYYPWQRGLMREELVARDGMVEAPAAPGWGVEIDPGWLERAEHRVTDGG